MSGFEKKEYEKINTNLKKAQAIITEFRATLDHKYPVAKDFDTIYTYVLQLMKDCNKNHDMETLEEILVQLRDLRDTWKQVMKAAR